jgi:hypothetical protein
MSLLLQPITFSASCSAHAHCKQDTVSRLSVLRLPSHNPSLHFLHPLRTTSIIVLVKEEAHLDPEYLSVAAAAEVGQLPDFTEIDGLVCCTPDSETQPRLNIPEVQARIQLTKRAHDSPTAGHLGFHKPHKSLHCLLYWPKMFHTVHES